jgi:hypothetical protein
MNELVPVTPREQWVHYSGTPDQIVMYDTDYSDCKGKMGRFKPIGLWITPYGQEDNWFEWATGEDFRVEELNFTHDVELAVGANILRISSVEGLDAFSQEYAIDAFADNPSRYHDGTPMESWMYCDWARLAQKYDGIIISPYQWERRLARYDAVNNKTRTDWYYSWDCASGCIWNAKAIESIKLRSTISAGYVSKPRRSIEELMDDIGLATGIVDAARTPSP